MAVFDVIGLGLNATDTVILLPTYPDYAGKVAFDREFLSPGGQVASAMVACARLGLRAAYIGTVGDDERGRIQTESLRGTGVDTTHLIARTACPNQTAYILVDGRSGERTVLWQRADCLRITPAEIDPVVVASARMLHIDGCDTEAAAFSAAIARSHAIPVSLDVDTVYPNFEPVLHNVDYLVASANWTRDWTGNPDPLTALPSLAREYGCHLCAMTLGDGGSLAYCQGSWHYAPAFDLPCIDTTGAGDVFHGAFCVAMLEGQPVTDALHFSNAAAGLNCTALGARGHVPTRPEVEALLQARCFRPPSPYQEHCQASSSVSR